MSKFNIRKNSPLENNISLFYSGSNFSPLLNLAIEAALIAGDVISEIYSSDFLAPSLKNDGSVLSEADLRANEVIIKKLNSSNLPILSEERLVSFEQRKKWDRYWLVDPLDGTKDFLNRNDEFTVNIALIEKGFPVIGVVSAPAKKKIWLAEKNRGAWRSENGSIKKINADANWPEQTSMFISRFHNSPACNKFALLNNIKNQVTLGSSLKIVSIASGEGEFYPRFSGSSEWDIAASHIILKEAGGFINDISGNNLIYNKENFLNPFFIAWRPPMQWNEIKIPRLTIG